MDAAEANQSIIVFTQNYSWDSEDEERYAVNVR